jgi:hypothetical protein
VGSRQSVQGLDWGFGFHVVPTFFIPLNNAHPLTRSHSVTFALYVCPALTVKSRR